MGFDPVHRSGVADQVCDAIRSAIISGEYGAGDRLPSERELAEQFSVNRSTIREALHRLEAWRLVEIRHGGGVMVQEILGDAGLHVLPWLLAPGGQIDSAMLLDILHLRVGLLTFSAEQAVERSDDEDLSGLQQAVERIEAAETPGQIQQADYAFFETLVAATHNKALMLVVSAITPVYENNRVVFAELYPAEMDVILHRACVDAIADGDRETAANAMKAYALAGLLAMQEAGLTTEEPAPTIDSAILSPDPDPPPPQRHNKKAVDSSPRSPRPVPPERHGSESELVES
jgi:GntR family transcriptional repressor for pyruvate dehydrogenase complex